MNRIILSYDVTVIFYDPLILHITQKLFKEVSKTGEIEALLNKYSEKTLLSKERTESKKYIASLAS